MILILQIIAYTVVVVALSLLAAIVLFIWWLDKNSTPED